MLFIQRFCCNFLRNDRASTRPSIKGRPLKSQCLCHKSRCRWQIHLVPSLLSRHKGDHRLILSDYDDEMTVGSIINLVSRIWLRIDTSWLRWLINTWFYSSPLGLGKLTESSCLDQSVFMVRNYRLSRQFLLHSSFRILSCGSFSDRALWNHQHSSTTELCRMLMTAQRCHLVTKSTVHQIPLCTLLRPVDVCKCTHRNTFQERKKVTSWQSYTSSSACSSERQNAIHIRSWIGTQTHSMHSMRLNCPCHTGTWKRRCTGI